MPATRPCKKKLNLKIKYRESFRPFAPSVLEEDAAEIFELKGTSPYMLLVQKVRNEYLHSLPVDFHSQSLRKKLETSRSKIQAITHIDFSARIQTVSAATNPPFHHLLKAFKQISGIGLLVNTSFNVRGEPIVCTPEDAYRCFMNTEMDYLVLGEYVFDKKNQPALMEKLTFEKD